MTTAITNKQRGEISYLEYVFISRQVHGNRLLIHGELYQRTLKQDVPKQRPSSLASKNICVDCLAIVRLVNSWLAAKTLSLTQQEMYLE